MFCIMGMGCRPLFPIMGRDGQDFHSRTQQDVLEMSSWVLKMRVITPVQGSNIMGR